MELVEFVSTGRSLPGDYISFSANGCIRFSKDLVSTLGAKEGTNVKFLQSATEPKRWFLKVAMQGFPLRVTSGTGSLGMSSSSLKNAIAHSTGNNPKKLFVMHVGPATTIAGIVHRELKKDK